MPKLVTKNTKKNFLKKMMTSATGMMTSLNVGGKQSTNNEVNAPPGHRTRDNGNGVHP